MCGCVCACLRACVLACVHACLCACVTADETAGFWQMVYMTLLPMTDRLIDERVNAISMNNLTNLTSGMFISAGLTMNQFQQTTRPASVRTVLRKRNEPANNRTKAFLLRPRERHIRRPRSWGNHWTRILKGARPDSKMGEHPKTHRKPSHKKKESET